MNTKDIKGTYFSCDDVESIYNSVKEEFMELFSNLELKQLQSDSKDIYEQHNNIIDNTNDKEHV